MHSAEGEDLDALLGPTRRNEVGTRLVRHQRRHGVLAGERSGDRGRSGRRVRAGARNLKAQHRSLQYVRLAVESYNNQLHIISSKLSNVNIPKHNIIKQITDVYN